VWLLDVDGVLNAPRPRLGRGAAVRHGVRGRAAVPHPLGPGSGRPRPRASRQRPGRDSLTTRRGAVTATGWPRRQSLSNHRLENGGVASITGRSSAGRRIRRSPAL